MFDPSEYTGKMGCIHAGFPCQDISVAGKQAGVSEGTRSGLYREVLRIASVVRPRYLFMENVAAIIFDGLGTVLGDLASMGFDARWCCLRASDCGASHRRERWWLLAYPNGLRYEKRALLLELLFRKSGLSLPELVEDPESLEDLIQAVFDLRVPAYTKYSNPASDISRSI